MITRRDAAAVRFDEVRLSRVVGRIRRDIDGGLYDGAALRVTQEGVVVMDLCIGFADREASRSLASDDVFYLFSLSKQLTATLAIKLIEGGVFRFTTPICEVIPEFGRAGKDKINVYHLLTQTSGLPDNREIPEITSKLRGDLEGFVTWSFDQPPIFPAGQKLSYSRALGHSVLAYFMQCATGTAFSTLMDSELFEPLGMSSTSAGPREDLLRRLCPARPARNLSAKDGEQEAAFRRGVDRAAEFLTPGTIVPAAGMFSTLGDLHRYVEMLRRGGELDGVRILSPLMIDYVARNRTGDAPLDVMLPFLDPYHLVEVPGNLGVGFLVRGNTITHGPFGSLNSPRTFGGAGRGSTLFWVDPEADVSLCLLTTGLIDEGANYMRCSTISDIVLSSIVQC